MEDSCENVKKETVVDSRHGRLSILVLGLKNNSSLQ
jgi:hypothetical protein